MTNGNTEGQLLKQIIETRQASLDRVVMMNVSRAIESSHAYGLLIATVTAPDEVILELYKEVTKTIDSVLHRHGIESLKSALS